MDDAAGMTATARRPGPVVRLAASIVAAVRFVAALLPAAVGGDAAAAGPAESVPVTVRAAAHEAFGRLVLEWPEPVTVDSTAAAGRFTLRFPKPMAADLDDAVARLADYLDGIARDDDSRALRLDLASGVHARLAQFEPHLVVVDLSREPPPPADAAVRVRTGEHDGFARLVFDWAEPTGYAVERSGRRLVITFERPAAIDAVAIGRRLIAWLDEASAPAQDDRSEVVLRLKPGVTADVFDLDEDKVVLDLRPDDDQAHGARAAVGRPAPAAGLAGDDPDAAAAAESALADATDVVTDPPSPELDVAEAAGAEALPALPAPAAGSPGPPLPALKPAPESAPTAAAAATEDALETADDLPLGTGPTLTASALAEGVELRVSWPRPLPAAAFRRAGHLWLVFDHGPALGEQPVAPVSMPATEGVLGDGMAIPSARGTVLRFPLRHTIEVAADREGATWRFILGRTGTLPAAVPITRLEESGRLRLGADGGGRVIEVLDPEVGDRILVWPVLEAGVGLTAAHRMVDLELLPTAQGGAWRARSDGLEWRRIAAGVEITLPGGLRLSGRPQAAPEASETEATAPTPIDRSDDDVAAGADEPDAAGDETQPDAASTAVSDGIGAPRVMPRDDPGDGVVLGLADWTLEPGQTVPERRATLMRALQTAPAEQRPRRRIDLARFFLAQAMAAEALATLATLQDEGDAPRPAAARGMRGAAAYLMGRVQEAAELLDAPALTKDPEIALWRAAVAAARDHWQRAARQLGRSGQTLASYPPVLQVRLGLPAAVIAAENGDHARARAILQRLAGLDLHAMERARLDFIRGLAHARAGAIDEADRLWRRLEASPFEETRIKAVFARTTLLLDAGLIGLEEALAKLGPARPLWRGHPWELGMLDRLGRIYRASGDPASAIRTWQEALRRHADAPEATGIRQGMHDTFATALATEGASDEPLAAIRALALFRDFPELRPAGPEGVALQRGLARRVAALDLLEPAAVLLQDLVERAPPGDAAHAEIVVELAALRLLAGEPEAALAALDTITGETLPPALAARRDLLRAKAMAQAGRSAQALELLARRADPDARALRLTILFEAEDWSGVVRSGEPLLEMMDPSEPLGDDAQAILLKVAIANAELARAEALEDLRARFAAALRDTPAGPAFLMATETPVVGRGPAALLAATGRQIDGVRRFLDRP